MRIWPLSLLCLLAFPPGAAGAGETLEDRLEALWASGGSPEDESAAAALLSAAEDPDVRVRTMAAAALGRMKKGPRVVKALLALAGDPDPAVRWQAVWALEGAPPESAVLALGARLEDQDETVRLSAASVLHAMDRSTRTVPALLRSLSSPDASSRSKACELLGGIPGASSAAAAALSGALGDARPEVREAAARSLARLGGPASAGTLAALAASLRDPDALVRMAAASALSSLSAKDRAAEISKLLDDEDAEVREAACGALRKLEGRARDCSLQEADERGNGALRPGPEPAERP